MSKPHRVHHSDTDTHGDVVPASGARALAAMTSAEGDDLVQGSSERQDRIRALAFEIFQARGEVDGHEVDDWLEAEARVGRGG